MQKYAVFSHPIVPFDYKNVGKTKKSAKKEINNERRGNNLIMQSYNLIMQKYSMAIPTRHITPTYEAAC